MGLFDSISGFFGGVGDFFGDVVGGIFDRPAPPRVEQAGGGQIGHTIGGIFGDIAGQIGEQIITSQFPMPTPQRQIPGPGGGPLNPCSFPSFAQRPECLPRGTIGAWPGMTPPAPRPAPSRDQVLNLAPRLTQPATLGSGPESAQSMVQQASPAAILPAIGLGLDIAHEIHPGGITGAARDVWNWATTDIRERTHPGMTGGAMPVLPGGAIAPGGQSMVGQPYGGMVFRPAPSGPRARSVLQIQNPYTGRMMWYRNMGTPILWSGDLSSAKRVRKAASRARRGR